MTISCRLQCPDYRTSFSFQVVNAFVGGLAAAFSISPETVAELLDTKVVSLELGVSRLAMQVQAGAMVPYARYSNFFIELKHTYI